MYTVYRCSISEATFIHVSWAVDGKPLDATLQGVYSDSSASKSGVTPGQ